MKIIHYAQQFHRTPKVLAKAVADLVKDPDLDIITLTEVGTRARSQVLSCAGWAVVQGDDPGRSADCAILVRNSRYSVIAEDEWQVTDIPYRSLPGRLVRGWWVVAAILEDREGKRILVTAGHPLAHLVSPLRKRIHFEGTERWGKLVELWAAEHGAERIIVLADWNLDFNKPATHHYLKHAFRGFRVVAPSEPTHDRRVIDGGLVKGFRPTEVTTLPKTPASDHAPVRIVLKEVPVDSPPPDPKPPSPPYVGPAKFHGGKTNKPINRLVVHATTGKCEPGAARGTARYFREDVVTPSSAHYITDPDESVQVVYDSYVAYHAPPNEHSLGFELTFNPTRVPIGQFLLPNRRKMIKRAARLVAEAAVYYDVPAVRLSVADLLAGKRGICGHIDVSNAWHQTSHWDPGSFPWRSFMKKVNREVEAIKAGL